MENNKAVGVYLQWDYFPIALVRSCDGCDPYSHSGSKASIFSSLGLASAFDEVAIDLVFHVSTVDAAIAGSAVEIVAGNPSPVFLLVVDNT